MLLEVSLPNSKVSMPSVVAEAMQGWQLADGRGADVSYEGFQGRGWFRGARTVAWHETGRQHLCAETRTHGAPTRVRCRGGGILGMWANGLGLNPSEKFYSRVLQKSPLCTSTTVAAAKGKGSVSGCGP